MAKHKGVYLRGNIYWIRYVGLDGKQVGESSESDKIGKAISMLRLRQGDIEKGEQPEAVKIKNYTFKELATEYLIYCQKQRDITNKTNMINGLILEFGNLPLRNFTTQLLEKYQSRLLSTPRPPLKGAMEPRPWGGVDLTTVSRLMGHKSLTMTLRYSHLAPNHLTTAVNVLNTTISISTKLAQYEEKDLRIVA